MTAASGADRCICGHDWSVHEQETLLGGKCYSSDSNACLCHQFRPASGADQPTLRDQLIDQARAFIVSEVGEDMGPGMTEQAERFVGLLLPLIEADRERAKAEGGTSCPTCVQEGGPYRCCRHCADDEAHEDVRHNRHDLPCTLCVRSGGTG